MADTSSDSFKSVKIKGINTTFSPKVHADDCVNDDGISIYSNIKVNPSDTSNINIWISTS